LPNKAGELPNVEILLKHITQYLQGHPDIIVTNFGLHGLHLLPARRAAVQIDFEPKLIKHFHLLNRLMPKTRIFYKLTNSICSDLFVGDYADALSDWRVQGGVALKGRLACIEQITGYISDPAIVPHEHLRYITDGIENITITSGRLCDQLLFDDAGVLYYNSIAYRVVRLFPKVRLLDSYSLTKNKCNCSTRSDGRHYGPLIPVWWETFLEAYSIP